MASITKNSAHLSARVATATLAVAALLGGCASDATTDEAIASAGQTLIEAPTAVDAGLPTLGDVVGGGALDAGSSAGVPPASGPCDNGRSPSCTTGDDAVDPATLVPIGERVAPLAVPLPVLDSVRDGSFVSVETISVGGVRPSVPADDEVGAGSVAVPGLEAGDVLLGFHEAAPGSWSAHGFNRARGEYWVDVGARPEDYGIRTDGGPPLRRPMLTDVVDHGQAVAAVYETDGVRSEFLLQGGSVLWSTVLDGVESAVRFSVASVEVRDNGRIVDSLDAKSWGTGWSDGDQAYEMLDYGHATDRYLVQEGGIEFQHVLTSIPVDAFEEYVVVEEVELPEGQVLWNLGRPIAEGETIETFSPLWLMPEQGTSALAPVFGEPRVWDAAGNAGRIEAASRTEGEAAFYRVTRESKTAYRVETVVRGTWLLDPAREFPVTIDPSAAWQDVLGVYDDAQDWEEPFTAWAVYGRTQYYLRASQLGLPVGSMIGGMAWHQQRSYESLSTGFFAREDAYGYLANTSDVAFPGAYYRDQGPFNWQAFGTHVWQGTAAHYSTNTYCPCPYPCGCGDWCLTTCWGCCFDTYNVLPGWWGQSNSAQVLQNRSNNANNDVVYTGANLRVTAGHDDGWVGTLLTGPTFDFRGCPNGEYCEIYNRGWFGNVNSGGLAWNSFARTRLYYHPPQAIGTNAAAADGVPSGWHEVDMYRVVLNDNNYCWGRSDVVLRTFAGTCGGDTRLWAWTSNFASSWYDDDGNSGACNETMSRINLGTIARPNGASPAFQELSYYVRVDEYGRDGAVNYNFIVDAQAPAVEVCNNFDDDCDGVIDDGVLPRWYRDQDGDNYGVSTNFVDACTRPAGYTAASGDCDDLNAQRNPGLAETVGNNVDNDCNNRELCFYDTDNDGYRPTVETRTPTYIDSADHDCLDSGEAVATDPTGDCNDLNAAVRPGVAEGIGDEIDQDCNGQEICVLDNDNDGDAPNWGATIDHPAETIVSVNINCTDARENRASDSHADCNDNNASIYSGAFEYCDTIDNDCDTFIDEGYGSIGAACDDGQDLDSCNDGVRICLPGGTASLCEHRGTAFYFPVDTNGTANLQDWSGNNLTGTLTQATASGAGPSVVDETSTNSRGVNLDGFNDYIEVADGTITRPSRKLTFAAWVRPETTNCDGNNNWRWLATRSADINAAPNWIVEENNSIAFSLPINGTTYRWWTGANFVPSNTWTHIAYTYDADTGTAQAYRNGALAFTWTTGTTASITQAASPFRIGNWNAATACPNGSGAMDGMVDDILFAGGAMSGIEINSLYLNGPTGTMVNAEICDGVDNDCVGTSADGSNAAVPTGRAFSAPGTACERSDDNDSCNEGGAAVCYADRLGSYCGDGPVMVLGTQAPYGGLARDVSGFGNHASLFNGTTWDAANQAFFFDGSDDYMQVPGAASLYTPAGYTVEAWIRPQTNNEYWTGVIGQQGIPSRYLSSHRSFHMWLGASDAGSGFIHHAYGCATNGNYTQNSGSTISTTSTGWTQVVITMDARGDQRIYVNGALAATQASCGQNFGASLGGVPLWIGRSLDGSANGYFRGWMRHIAVYPYAVSATKVLANFTGGGIPANERNAEICDGLNNDCAGTIDDPYLSSSLGQSCDTALDTDLCADGLWVCAANTYQVTCNDTTPSTIEVCNSADDDCDGSTDEGLTLYTYYRDADADGAGDAQRTTSTCAVTAPSGYASNQLDCSDASDLVRPGAAERCNGFDDDCDGSTDEGNPQGGGSCAASALGICANGTQFCPGQPTYPFYSVDSSGFIRNWLLLGSFPGGACGSVPTPPFTIATLRPEPGTVTAGRTWTSIDATTSPCGGASCGGGGVNLACAFPTGATNAYAYGWAHVYSPVARSARLRMGSDDGARVWVNGAEVPLGAAAACRGCAIASNVADVSLAAGWNSVVIGVSQGGGGWEYNVQFVSTVDNLPMRDLRVSYDAMGAIECAPGLPVTVGGVPTELCNGLDDDCNGAVPVTEVDNDGDLVNECGGGDCNDADNTVYPGAPDRCDGQVNNCTASANPDPGFDVGAACDGADDDLCTDGQKVCAASELATVCADRGPVASFDFRDGTGTTATNAAGSGLSGTLTGFANPSAAWVTNGRSGSALTFNGTSGRVEFGTTGLSNRRGTIEFWMRPGFGGSDALARGMFQTNSGVNSNNWISIFKWAGASFYFRIGNAGGCCANDLTFDPTAYITSGAWSHWAFTWDDSLGAGAGVMRIYVNGVLRASRTNATLDGPALSALASIGVGHDTPMLGTIDEFAAYNYAMTASQVTARYTAARLDAVGVNTEFCDGLDNDCDTSFDEGNTINVACDGPDADQCLDARTVCSSTSVGTMCSGGAGAILKYEDPLNDLLAFDWSGSNNQGQLTINTSRTTVGGRNALDLVGTRTSRANIPAAAGTNTEFTFATWVRRNPSSTNPTAAIVHRSSTWATGTGACDANGFAIWTSGRIYLQCQSWVNAALATELQALDNRWTHVAATYDRGTLKIYLNGSLLDSRSWPQDQFRTITWNSDIWLGQDQDAANAGFTDAEAYFGSFDETVWYSHPLSASEIAALAAYSVPAIDVNYEFCDALDNDCDSPALVDEIHTPPLGDACTVGLGICARPGYRICAADGFGTVCDGTPGTPETEVCNNIDDNCDGVADDPWPDLGESCTVGIGACARTGIYICSGDGSGVVCSATPGEPSEELCDLVDNDCDGGIDNNPFGGDLYVDCYSGPSGNLLVAPAVCRPGQALCSGGVTGACVGEVFPSAERCDDLDWNCDGQLNEGFDIGEPCTNGQFGACERTGFTYCSDDISVGCDATTVVPTLEVCGDFVDNDCDGETDEGVVEGALEIVAVNSGSAGFDYTTCDMVAPGSPTCSAVTFTVTVDETSPYAVSAGSDVTLLRNAGTPVVVGAGVTLPRTVNPGETDTFVYCWSNSSVQNDAVMIVEIDTSCTLLSTDPDNTDPADLIRCGPETCDGGDNDGDSVVDEVPDACFDNPTLSCVNDAGRFSCVPTLEDGTPECADDGCFPSGGDAADATPAPSSDASPAAGAQTSAESAVPGSEPAAGCASARSAAPAHALLPMLALVAIRRRRRAA